uniref:Uncharacterized protein n=1 Tax=Arundo donax TaxID=35708 RepID=A0A0A8YCZ3_ARUDO
MGVPRFHKLEFPTFDGKEDPLGWLTVATSSSGGSALWRPTRCGLDPTTSPASLSIGISCWNATAGHRHGNASRSCEPTLWATTPEQPAGRTGSPPVSIDGP